MAVLIKTKEIFVEFLRMAYKEPARTGLSKRHTSVSNESHSPAAASTEITVDNTKLLCVNSVTVNAVSKYKYLDYDIDLRNNKLVFKSAFAGTETVLISYDYNTSGISWIYPANPERDRSTTLARTDYPRVVISELSFSGDFLGFSSDTQEDTVVFQIDVATKKGLECSDYVRVKTTGSTETISEKTRNSNTVDMLMMGIRNAIKRNWRTELKYKFYPSPDMFKGETQIDIDNDIGIFRRVLDVELKGFNLGEAS